MVCAFNRKKIYVHHPGGDLAPICTINDKGHSSEYYKVLSEFGKK